MTTNPHAHQNAVAFDPDCDLCQLAAIVVRLARANQESQALKELLTCLYPELIEHGRPVIVDIGEGLFISMEQS